MKNIITMNGGVILGTAQTRASNKYAAKAYDRIALQVKKGKKAELQTHADIQKESLNGFINRAIDETMQRDVSTTDTLPQKKESLPQKEKPTTVVTQTDDDLTEEIPTLLKTIQDNQKTPSKSTLTQMVAGQIITDKMNYLRSENHIEEYIALTNLFATTPKSKAQFMAEVKNANFMSDVDEAINALLIFHGLKDGE